MEIAIDLIDVPPEIGSEPGCVSTPSMVASDSSVDDRGTPELEVEHLRSHATGPRNLS